MVSCICLESFSISPTNTSVPLNSTATFFCQPLISFGPDVIWTIKLASSNQALNSFDNLTALTTNGFSFSATSDTALVLVFGSLETNGTSVACIESNEDSELFMSDTAFLTVYGKLSPYICIHCTMRDVTVKMHQLS